MATTVRAFLSSLSNDCKAANIDTWLNPKTLYEKSQAVIGNFLAKDNNSNGLLFKTTVGWSSLKCVDMEEVEITTCNIDVHNCRKLLKSKQPLPSVYEGKFGVMLRQCSNLDFSVNYKNIFTPQQWNAVSKREFQKDKYFFVIDNYLYIPLKSEQDPTPEKITIQGYFKNLKDVDVFNSTEECQSCKETKQICKKLIDYEMVIPTYLEDEVKKEVVRQLASVYLKITLDENPNMDENIKSIDPRSKP